MALQLKKKSGDAEEAKAPKTPKPPKAPKEGKAPKEAKAPKTPKAGKEAGKGGAKKGLSLPKLGKGAKAIGPAAVVLTESGEPAGYQIPTGKPRKGRSYGVDLDGNVVRVVELLDNDVISYGTYQGVTTDDAFRKFLSTRPSGEVNVSWMGTNMHVLRVPVPVLPDSALRLGILDAVDDSLPITNGSASIAARLFKSANGVTMAAVAAVEKESTASLWEMVGNADVSVVPAPLLMVHDGLYLGVRYSDSNLMLVAGGAVVAARPLAVGGLTSMFEKLGGDPSRAAERFATVARGGTRLDPDAATVVDNYSATIGDEVRRTVDFWARQGNNVPSEVFVHGPGIVLPNLSGKLLDAALFARPVGLPDVSMETIARTERPTAYMALLAAKMELGTQPVGDLVDPRSADRALRNKEKAKKSVRLFGGIAVAALAVLAFVVPYGFAKTRNVLATNSRRAAEAKAKGYAKELKLKADVEQGVKAYNATVANELAWEPLFKSMFESAPAGLNPTFQSFAVAPGEKEVLVTFSAVMKNPPQTPEAKGGFDKAIASWIDNLKSRGSSQPWPNSFVVAIAPAAGSAAGAAPAPADPAAPNTGIITGSFTAPIPLDPTNPVTKAYLASREITTPGATPAATSATTIPNTTVKK
jgi:hypothetical protein